MQPVPPSGPPGSVPAPRPAAVGPAAPAASAASPAAKTAGAGAAALPKSGSSGLWKRAQKAGVVASKLAGAQQTAREMNRVMDYEGGVGDAEPENHYHGKWIVLPDSTFRKVWDAAQVVLLCYVAMVTPLRIGFDIEVELFGATWFWEVLVDIYFIADIFINFRSAYQTGTDRFVEKDPVKIRRAYIRSWFFIDLVACLPVSYVLSIIKALSDSDEDSKGGDLKAIKIIRLLRLAKLLRLARLKRMLKVYEEEFHGIISSCKLLSLCLFMVYVTHVIACFWYMFGSEHQTIDCPDGATDSCVNATLVPWVHAEFGEEAKTDVPLSRRYLTAFYWAITTLSTVGYGDITPVTDFEKLYACIAELGGSMIFGMMIGSLSTMLMSGKALEEKIDNQLAELQEFMTSKNIPKALHTRVRKYMELFYEKKSSYDEQAVLESLPPVMANDLMEAMYKDIVDTVPLFRGLEPEIISRLCVTLRPYQALGNEFIYKQGEIGKELYIILQGRVEMTRDLHRLGVLGAGSFFGHEAVLSRSGAKEEARPTKRERSARAVENCNLAFLTRDDVVKVATDYPTMEVRLRNLATRRAKKDDKLLKELIAEKQKKEEDALMQQLAAVSGAAVAFAGRIEMSADEMELYEAALKIQKVVRGHQARASAAGKIRKMLIQSVLTVDAMSEGITAVLLTSEDGFGAPVFRRAAGELSIVPSNPETAKEASLLWHPEHGAPLTIPFSSLSALTYGYNSNTFRAALEADEDLEAEWRCFSVYQGDGGAARSGGSEEVRQAEAAEGGGRPAGKLNLDSAESLVLGPDGDRPRDPSAVGFHFQIPEGTADLLNSDSLVMEWVATIDRLSQDSSKSYEGIDRHGTADTRIAKREAEITEKFFQLDLNQDGELSENELRLLLHALGEKSDDDSVASLISSIGGEGGMIKLEHFKQWMHSLADQSDVRGYLILCRQRWKIRNISVQALNEEAEAVKLLTRDRTASAASDPFGSDGARSPRADALEAQSRSMAQQMEDLRQEGLRREKETQSQLAAILEELKQLRQQGR